ncbi:MAG: hypothetical protein KatS3mg087_1539 [Patescibacteria group bacterium]|nr:MAG: hypothetical protein KatS3mg087_1539 [Patescibacteria group bacterium]
MRKIEKSGQEILRRDASEQWIDGVYEVHETSYPQYDDDDHENRPYIFDISRPQGRFRFQCRVFGAEAKNRCRQLSEGDLIYLRGQIHERVYFRRDGTESSYVWISPVLIKHIGSVDMDIGDDDDIFAHTSSNVVSTSRQFTNKSTGQSHLFDVNVAVSEPKMYDDDDDDDDDEDDDEQVEYIDASYDEDEENDIEDEEAEDEEEEEEEDSVVLVVEEDEDVPVSSSRRKGRRPLPPRVAAVNDPFA